MNKKNRKKGFSLIELIVVIAVIAAIAAVIVPQFGNMTNAAKNSVDQRNVQLWNEVYANAYAIIGNDTATTNTNLTLTNWMADNNTALAGTIPNIDVQVKLGTADGTAINFNAPGFKMTGADSSSYKFQIGKGLYK